MTSEGDLCKHHSVIYIPYVEAGRLSSEMMIKIVFKGLRLLDLRLRRSNDAISTEI